MKQLLTIFSSIFLFYACSTEEVRPEAEQTLGQAGPLNNKKCGTTKLSEQRISEDPDFFQKRANYDAFIANRILEASQESAKASPIITVPVIVHILYNKEADKFSKQFVRTQIGVLNNAFKGTNGDISKVPEKFVKSLAGDTRIRFDLRRIIYKATDVEAFSINDFSEADIRNPNKGGSAPIDPVHKLNIWVANLDGFAGAAFKPEHNVAPEQDGIMMNRMFFGLFESDTNPLNLGRTLVHEAGHYLGLRHLWGDDALGPTGCRTDDGVGDTPNSSRGHTGVPVFPVVTCGSEDMFMNYMDFTDDKALLMFTKGQTKRMRAAFDFETRKNIGVFSN